MIDLPAGSRGGNPAPRFLPPPGLHSRPKPAGRIAEKEDMTYVILASGIDTADVAWTPLGWRCAWVSEIDPFCCALHEHYHPDVPNLGDMMRITDDQIEEHGPVDLVAGGTPCQSFSVAGLRAGLADPRGNLALVFLGLVERIAPRWVVWENVPGVLSSSGGRDFGAFLGALAELGYGWAYRVLDAQYIRVDGLERAVPQRRRRVFVVGHLGDWRRAAAVLLERESLCGHTPPRREAGKGVAPILEVGARTSSDGNRDGDGIGKPGDPMYSLQAKHQHGIAYGGNNPGEREVSTALNAKGGAGRMDFESENAGGQIAVAFAQNQRGELRESEIAPQLTCGGGKPGEGFPAVRSRMTVRRLTPRECERLQGLPDDYTAIPYRGKPAADGPRYRALGSAWAVNCARWIGQRIKLLGSLAHD